MFIIDYVDRRQVITYLFFAIELVLEVIIKMIPKAGMTVSQRRSRNAERTRKEIV